MGTLLPKGVHHYPPDPHHSENALWLCLEQVQQLVCTPPEDGENRLEELYGCCQQAPQPAAGQRHTVWFRMRMLITRLRDRCIG